MLHTNRPDEEVGHRPNVEIIFNAHLEEKHKH